MTNIMIDIETAGLVTQSAILSIGAVKFFDKTPYLGEEFKVNITLDSCKKEGLIVHQATLNWWDKQSEEAQRRLLTPKPITLRNALMKLRTWLGQYKDEVYVWAKPSFFDIPILKYTYACVGYTEPWDRHRVMDLQTLELAARVFGLRTQDYDGDFIGVKHDALDDAKWQGERAGRILQLMKGGSTYAPFEVPPVAQLGTGYISPPTGDPAPVVYNAPD